MNSPRFYLCIYLSKFAYDRHNDAARLNSPSNNRVPRASSLSLQSRVVIADNDLSASSSAAKRITITEQQSPSTVAKRERKAETTTGSRETEKERESKGIEEDEAIRDEEKRREREQKGNFYLFIPVDITL